MNYFTLTLVAVIVILLLSAFRILREGEGAGVDPGDSVCAADGQGGYAYSGDGCAHPGRHLHGQCLGASERGGLLRYLQTLNEIAGEKNSTIVFPVPVDFLERIMGGKS